VLTVTVEVMLTSRRCEWDGVDVDAKGRGTPHPGSKSGAFRATRQHADTFTVDGASLHCTREHVFPNAIGFRGIPSDDAWDSLADDKEP